MAELNAEIAPEVISACQASAAETADALGRALDGEFSLEVGEPTDFNPANPPEHVTGPALAILLQFGKSAAAVLIPETSGVVPDWCTDPDATGESRLATLAQELSFLLVPDSLESDGYQAGWVADCGEALVRAGVAEPATLVPLTLKRGDNGSPLSLIWPLANPAELMPSESPAVAASVESNTATSDDFSQLPAYSRSLLKIQVPVGVTLACKKEPIQSIVDLVPGSIIQFDKSYDEFLQLTVGDQPVADGDAVKVGDKFGLRIHQMVMPPEHFGRVVANTVQINHS